MGLDAESTDLTARIQRRRAALVAAGEVDPARPGEHRAFRGQPGAVAPPRDIPTRGARRVVQVDETPTRGGADALAESEVETETTYDPQADPELTDSAPEEDIDPFTGKPYTGNDEFDLGDESRIEAVAEMAQAVEDTVDAMMPSTRGAAQASSGDPSDLNKPLLPTHPRGKKRTTLSALNGFMFEFEKRIDGLERGIMHLGRQLDAIEQGLLLLAEAVAQQGKDDVPDVEHGDAYDRAELWRAEYEQPERSSFLRSLLFR